MLELRCPACGRANAVLDEAALDEVRCAACTGALDEGHQVRYRVAGPGRGWGTQVYSDLLFRVAGGTLGPRMRISEEGGPWFRAGERDDLFAAAPEGVRRQKAHAAPRGQKPARVPWERSTRAARAKRRHASAPGSVATMAGLCKTLGIVILLLAVGGFFLAASLGAAGGGMLVFLILLGLGWGQIAIGGGLQRASVAARNAQLGLAVVAGGIYLLALGDGAPGPFILLGGMFVAIPFFLLLNKEAKAWFAGTWRER